MAISLKRAEEKPICLANQTSLKLGDPERIESPTKLGDPVRELVSDLEFYSDGQMSFVWNIING